MNDKKYEDAKKRVKRLKAFYNSLITYIGVNILLIAVNLITSPDNLWFYWVTIFWGLALVINGAKLFMTKNEFLGTEWEEKKINEILEKDKDK
ncbi:MAG: 2TM domain-containing protein [Kiritimatiellae bacterium]|jgi:hypothetical protein|nr:2TM domain-containing protein [Kiritimatiellia bacterium]